MMNYPEWHLAMKCCVLPDVQDLELSELGTEIEDETWHLRS